MFANINKERMPAIKHFHLADDNNIAGASTPPFKLEN